MMGDRSLFTRPDGLAHVWEVANGILNDKPEPLTYPKNSGALQRPANSSPRIVGSWVNEACDAAGRTLGVCARSKQWRLNGRSSSKTAGPSTSG